MDRNTSMSSPSINALRDLANPAPENWRTVIAETATRIADLVREMTKVLKTGREELLEELRAREAADEESEAEERAS